MSSKINYYKCLKLNEEIDTLIHKISERINIKYNKIKCGVCDKQPKQIIIKMYLDDKIIRRNYYCSRKCFEYYIVQNAKE